MILDLDISVCLIQYGDFIYFFIHLVYFILISTLLNLHHIA